MIRHLASLAVLLFLTAVTNAATNTETFTYTKDDQVFEGYLVKPADSQAPAPAVLIVHQWTGPSDHERGVARRLAEKGYIAMVVDVFGEGIRPTPGPDAAAVTTTFRQNRQLLRDRVALAHGVIAARQDVDASRIAIIGYCFGGMAALEMARAGANVAGVVSFHGALAADEALPNADIKASILVLHGAADPLVPPAQVQAFQDEMHASGADWQLIAYGGAKHSFTEPSADLLGMDAVGYDPDADRRSWAAMLQFFDEIFAH